MDSLRSRIGDADRRDQRTLQGRTALLPIGKGRPYARVEGCLREIAQLHERNQELEGEMSKAARRGKLEEISFEQDVRTWAGISVSEKLPKNGDFILAYRAPNGDPLEPPIARHDKDVVVVSHSLVPMIFSLEEVESYRDIPAFHIAILIERQLCEHEHVEVVH